MVHKLNLAEKVDADAVVPISSLGAMTGQRLWKQAGSEEALSPDYTQRNIIFH